MKHLLRDLFYILILLAACVSLDAQELNKNALMVKTESKAQGLNFYNEIKTLAEKDWKGNHEMMIYTINKQADAIVDFIEATSSENYDINIMAVAMGDWTDKKGLRDYVMIIYQYNKQMKAKGNY